MKPTSRPAPERSFRWALRFFDVPEVLATHVSFGWRTVDPRWYVSLLQRLELTPSCVLWGCTQVADLFSVEPEAKPVDSGLQGNPPVPWLLQFVLVVVNDDHVDGFIQTLESCIPFPLK